MQIEMMAQTEAELRELVKTLRGGGRDRMQSVDDKALLSMNTIISGYPPIIHDGKNSLCGGFT
jgi:hypothetical protein